MTNRRRASRLVVPALVATFCVSAASACAGGVMTAAQMVCCVHDHHECEMTMDGDSCCTGEFHSSQQFVHAPKAKFHVDVVTLIAACPPAGSMALPTAATFFLASESQLRAALQAFEAAPGEVESPSGTRERLDIRFESQPDPPAAGRNAFEVTVRDPAGQPIGDAEVAVVFFMAAMPTMNMPAMKTETLLLHVADGVYRGTGDVMMAGRWDVSVQVARAGALLGTAELTVVAQ